MRLVRLLVPVALALLPACGGPEPSPDTERPRVTLTSPGAGVVVLAGPSRFNAWR